MMDALAILSSLDRCEHGRHRKDNCFECPGGQSTGNLILVEGMVIGHGVRGVRIVVPHPDKVHVAREWLDIE